MFLKNGLKWVWGVSKHILVLQSRALWNRRSMVLVAGKRVYVLALKVARVLGRIMKGVLRRIPARRLVSLAIFLSVCVALLLGAWALGGRFSGAAIDVKRDFASEASGPRVIGAMFAGVWVVFGLWVAVVFLRGVFAEVGIDIQKAEPYPDTGQAGERKKFRLPHIELGWGHLFLIWFVVLFAVELIKNIF